MSHGRGHILSALALASALCASCTPDVEPVTTCSGITLDKPLLVLESDRVSSALGRLDTNGCLTERPSLVLGADPTLCSRPTRPFVCISDQSRIAEVDPESGLLMTDHIWNVVSDAESATQADPWWVEPMDDGTLWVLRYNLSSIAVLNDQGKVVDEIDLTPVADSDLTPVADRDGIPEMARAITVGDRVYVLLERLDSRANYAANESGAIAALDPTSRSLLPSETIALAGRDPWTFAADPTDARYLYVADGGDFLQPKAGDTQWVGIERVDLMGGTTEMILTESQLGGAPVDLALTSSTDAYAIVADRTPTAPSRLVHFNPTTRQVDAPWLHVDGFNLWGIAPVSQYVAVGDNTSASPAIYFYDQATGARAATVAVQTLPPIGLLTLP